MAIIDPSTLSLVKQLTIGFTGGGMALSPDDKKLFIAGAYDLDQPAIGAIDLDRATVLPRIPAPFPSYDIAVSRTGSLFIGPLQSGIGRAVAEIDSVTGAGLRTFPTTNVGFLELSPDRNTLYVGPLMSNFALVAMDVRADPITIIRQTPWENQGARLIDFKLSHNGRFLGINESTTGSMFKVASNNLGSLATRFVLPRPLTDVGPIAFSPDDKKVYLSASNTVDHYVYVFDSASGRLLQKITTDYSDPGDMAVDSSGRLLFIVSPFWNEIRVFATGEKNLSGPITKPKSLLNVSTRLRTGLGDDVLIGGFIITGPDTKKVVIRAVGPSLPVSGQLLDPVLELHDHTGAIIGSNDNWNSHRVTAMLTGLAPDDEHESFITTTLPPGRYTTILRGVHSSTGVALVEVYDLSSDSDSKLANISSRGKVETGDNVMIGGFIIGGNQPTKVIVRAIGPSLASAGVHGAPSGSGFGTARS